MPLHPRNEIEAHIGRRIRLRRMELGLSQEAVAGSLGVTFQQLHKYESGANGARGSRLLQLAKALKVAPDYFFDGLPGTGAKLADRDTTAIERMMVATAGADVARSFLQLSRRSRMALRAIAEALVAAEMADDKAEAA